MSTQAVEDVERTLREEQARVEAAQSIKTYVRFCIHRYDYSRGNPNGMENRKDANRSIVLEFISIVCERISILPIASKRARRDFPIIRIETHSAIDLPKSMSTQRVRVSPSTSNQDIRNMVRGIQSAIGDLDAHEIRTAIDPLSELLPLGGWHPVNTNFKIIYYQKDSTYEEFIPKKCVIPSCVVCDRIAARKRKSSNSS
jgi:hypothetical protein